MGGETYHPLLAHYEQAQQAQHAQLNSYRSALARFVRQWSVP
jgi:hypothetical protein